jgi:hypothetical protein
LKEVSSVQHQIGVTQHNEREQQLMVEQVQARMNA